MRIPILVPHTKLHPQTSAALEALPEQDWRVELVDCTDDNWAYQAAFCRRWRARQTFVIVEHDLVPAVDQLTELRDCPEPWCTQPYTHPYHEAKHHVAIFEAFGVVKFEGSFIARWPQLTTEILDINLTDNKFARWIQLDSRFLSVALKHGLNRHKHQSVVPHWHWQTLGIVIEQCDEVSWMMRHNLPWPVVATLNPHLPSDRLADCQGQFVQVQFCRPIPDRVLIADWAGNVIYDGVHPTQLPSPVQIPA